MKGATEHFVKGADGIYYLSPDKYARNGIREYLIEKDGYAIPMQVNAHALDSPDIPGVTPDKICLGIDTISNMLSYWGGGVELTETLVQALLNEGKEECGENRDIRFIDRKIITFGSLNDKRNLENDDIATEEPEVGTPFKLRTVFRVASRQHPQQQEPALGHLYPEFLRPRYESVSSVLHTGRMLRKSCQYAITKAMQAGIMFLDTQRLPAVEPDLESLASAWERMRIHPALIDYYCGGYGKVPSLRLKYIEQYGDIIAPVMLNMRYQEEGLNQLLCHRRYNDAEIRQEWKEGREEAARLQARET